MTMHVRDLPARLPLKPSVQPLVNGDHLSQPEFHRRYQSIPEKVELVGGVVYVASPTRLPHGSIVFELATVPGVYKAATPGVRGAENVTAILGARSEPQPDLCLRLLPEHGGRSREDEQQYLVGPPELVIEVARSTEALDLHGKRADYRAAGVGEYLVLCVKPGKLSAFDLATDRELSTAADGTFRSKRFPGLWIDVPAILAGNTADSLATLQRGLAAAEHAQFVERLQKKVKTRRGTRPRRRK